jgi:hypothetical protein
MCYLVRLSEIFIVFLHSITTHNSILNSTFRISFFKNIRFSLKPQSTDARREMRKEYFAEGGTTKNAFLYDKQLLS